MAKGNYGIKCHCCGADITAPQFFNGKPYGWSCVLKQSDKYKRTRNTGFWITADEITFKKDVSSNRFIITATIGGECFSEYAYIDLEHYKKTGQEQPKLAKNIQGGLVRIATNNNGSDVLWKLTTVETAKDGKHKPYPIAIEVYSRKGTKKIWRLGNN